MVTATPSTTVTDHPDTNPNSALYVIADREMSDLHMCRWFSGRILAYHAGDPGSIPGRCRLYFHTYTP